MIYTKELPLDGMTIIGELDHCNIYGGYMPARGAWGVWVTDPRGSEYGDKYTEYNTKEEALQRIEKAIAGENETIKPEARP